MIKKFQNKFLLFIVVLFFGFLFLGVGSSNATVVIRKHAVVTKKITKIASKPKKIVVKAVLKKKTVATIKAKPKNVILSQTSVIVQKLKSVDVFVQGSDVVTAVSDSTVVRTAVNIMPATNNVKVTIYGSAPGTANIKICNSDHNCAVVRVKVFPNISGGFSVSERNVTLTSGDTYWLKTVNGGNISVIANNGLINPIIKNNFIFLAANNTGSTIFKVCSENGSGDCSLVYVNVVPKATPPSIGGSFSSITVEQGQSKNIPFPNQFALSYGVSKGPSNPSVATLFINKDSFTVQGNASGTAMFEVCPVAPGYSCGTIGVVVTKQTSCGQNSGILTLNQSSITIKQSELMHITSSDCTGLVAFSGDADVVRTGVNGNQINLYPVNVGEVTVQVCDATATCVPLSVKVVAGK